MSPIDNGACLQIEHLTAFAVGSLSENDAVASAEHLAGCDDCARELDSLCPLAESMVDWPWEIPPPATGLWHRLLQCIGTGDDVLPGTPDPDAAREDRVDWHEVSRGTFCKVLSVDAETRRVSLLVRLLPGAEYPPHEHADVEELHLLHGELWIDERRLAEGDYNRAEAGSTDRRVWSETGCSCLLITSLQDRLILSPVS